MLNSSEWTSLYSLEYEAMVIETKIRNCNNGASLRELYVVRHYMDLRIDELKSKMDE
jgi:hypothetical protein